MNQDIFASQVQIGDVILMAGRKVKVYEVATDGEGIVLLYKILHNPDLVQENVRLAGAEHVILVRRGEGNA